MEAVTIALKTLNNDGYLTYMHSYLDMLAGYDLTVLKIGPQHAALSAKITELDGVYKQVMASSLTQVIADLDVQRDNYLSGISLVVSGYQKHFDSTKADAANKMAAAISVYGTATEIARKSLINEAGAVKNLVEALQAADMAPFVAALGLTDWITQLQTVNNSAYETYMQRAHETGPSDPNLVKRLRLEANDLFYALRNMLMAQALVANYADPFDKAINDVNALTEDVNDSLAQHQGNLDAENNEAPPPTS